MRRAHKQVVPALPPLPRFALPWTYYAAGVLVVALILFYLLKPVFG